MFDDVDASLLDVSAAGVCEAVGEADCSFVVEEDGRPVGVAIAHPDRSGLEAELLALWVHPEYAGREVAARLLSRVAAALADQGVSRLRTTVDADRPETVEFYRSHGFSADGSLERFDGGERVLIANVSTLR